MVDRNEPPLLPEPRSVSMDREPTPRERAQAILAQKKAEHAAERRAAPLRAAAEIQRQEGEAIRRDEREEFYRERGY